MFFLVQTILFLLFFFYFFLLLRLWFGLGKLKSRSLNNLQSVSTIIAMKNEEKNVRQCLESLIKQDYPKNLLEIFIVDDGSTDKTPLILDEYDRKNSFISVLKINGSEPIQKGKKNALTRAIKKSNGEILLFTDGDCAPPHNWIRSMVACFEPNVGLAAGFSPLIDPSDSLFGTMLKLDSLAAGIVAAGSIGLDKAVTCTGRNLAYRREVFDQINGFEKIKNSVSGDDDLILQLVKNETQWEIRYTTNFESIVPSFQTKSLIDFFRQKRRHLSAGKYYNFKVQMGYFLFHLANLLFYLFPIYALFVGRYIVLSAALLISKFIMDWLLIKLGSKKFDLPVSLLNFLLWEIFFCGYNSLIGPTSWFGKIKW